MVSFLRLIHTLKWLSYNEIIHWNVPVTMFWPTLKCSRKIQWNVLLCRSQGDVTINSSCVLLWRVTKPRRDENQCHLVTRHRRIVNGAFQWLISLYDSHLRGQRRRRKDTNFLSQIIDLYRLYCKIPIYFAVFWELLSFGENEVTKQASWWIYIEESKWLFYKSQNVSSL